MPDINVPDRDPLPGSPWPWGLGGIFPPPCPPVHRPRPYDPYRPDDDPDAVGDYSLGDE